MSTFRGANPFDHLPPAVKNLIVANVLIFIVQMFIPPTVIQMLALTPTMVIHKLWLWQVVTYAFLHGNFWHLFFNIFGLWMFGPPVELNWGTKSFLCYYFVCAVGAALSQFLLAPDQTMIGASGAIYGVLLAFGLLFPDSVIYLFFFFPLRAIQAVLVIAVMTFLTAVNSGGSQIAHFAHLGGMATGYLFLKFPAWMRDIAYARERRRVVTPQQLKRKQIETASDDNLFEEVDRILGKISSQGVGSLTPKEHETMQRYATKKKQ